MRRRSSGSSATPTNREVLALAIPALGGLAAEPLMGLLDTALIGRLGSTELAALGGANALLSLLAASLIFLEYGTTARLGRRYGAGETELLRREAAQMGWLATLLGLILTGLFYFFAGPLLGLLGVGPEVHEAGTTYLTIRAFGMVSFLWTRVGHGIFRGLQDTRTPLLLVVGMNLLNAGLSIVLIFGWDSLGISPFGIAGAAWGTVVASWVGAISFGLLLRGRFGLDSKEGRSIVHLRWDLLRSMLMISRDLLLRTLGLQAALFAGTKFAARFGTDALAAHQVAWQLWLFLALLLDSLAIAGQALISRFLGAGMRIHARRIGRKLNLWGLVLGCFFAALFLLLDDVLPRIFTSDPLVLQAIGTIFGLLALMQIPNAILFVLDGLLIGASDFVFLRNAMVALGLFGVACAWCGAVLGGNLLGVWLGIAVFMIGRLLVMAGRWRGDRWMGLEAAERSSSRE